MEWVSHSQSSLSTNGPPFIEIPRLVLAKGRFDRSSALTKNSMTPGGSSGQYQHRAVHLIILSELL